jgi:tetratricopeptide (TPR) repeat protein
LGKKLEMPLHLDGLISKAQELVKRQDSHGAMLLANELVKQYPNEIKAWSLRAYLHERNENYTEAVADLTRAIDINALEPHFLYSRGRYYFGLGDDQSAVNDFSKGLVLCDYHNSDYYREELHFWRAEALLRLGKRQEALLDIACVGNELALGHTSCALKQIC